MGKCYKYYEARVLWDDARQNCKSNAPNDSGDLASVTSTEIHEFISTLGTKFWIGGKDRYKGDNKADNNLTKKLFYI